MADFLNRTLADPAVTAVGIAFGVACVALWLAAAWWVYGDAARRSESVVGPMIAGGWIVISTPVLLPLSLGIYTLVRPQRTVGESRTQNLMWALSSSAIVARRCPECDIRVEADWRRCPSCTTWLEAPCARCGAWSDRELPICPWCASEGHAEPFAPRIGAGSSARHSLGRRGAVRLTRGHPVARASRRGPGSAIDARSQGRARVSS